MIKIVKDSKPSLRDKSIDVAIPLSKKDEELLLEMLDYLKKSQDREYCEKHHLREGVGLAAPQVGKNKRMIVIYYDKLIDENKKETISLALVNPIIIAGSVKKAFLKAGEGCLSVDNPHEGYVYRDFKIVIKAYDAIAKREVEIAARGYDAIVLQHEIDHLNGILFYDHINKKEPFINIDNSVAI
ncbi:MAG: peptide deformylase [Bacilli bacterium]|jgi:peptide deformylase